MLHNFLIGFGLFIVYFIAAGLPPILLKVYRKTPFEMTRKMYHLVITLSIIPLLALFSDWYLAVLAVFLFLLMIYPVLTLVEHASFYKRIAVEREGGEFKRSFILVQLMIASLIFVFWGLLGDSWRYIAVVAMMAWGFGDAAAALVGKAFGRRRIRHRRIEGTKTVAGAHAMFAVSGLATFITIELYAGQPWHVSLVVSLIVAVVSSAVELFSRRGMDTLTVPISAGLTTLALLILISFLGV